MAADSPLFELFDCIIQGHRVGEAEAALAQMAEVPGFGVGLAQVALATDQTASYRRLAAVLLRQHTEAHWSTLSKKYVDGTALIGADEKAVLRENILAGVVDEDRHIRTLISATVAKVAHFDWPNEWPTVFDTLTEGLQAGSPNTVHGVLRCMDDFVLTMNQDHMITVIPMVCPELLRVFRNEHGLYSIRDQMRAVSVYCTCLQTLYPVLKSHADDAMSLLRPNLPEFLAGFEAVLSAPDAEGGDCGLKIAVLDAVSVLILRYAKYVGGDLAPLMTPIWNGVVSGTAFYERAVLQELEKPVQYSDGEPRGLEFQLASMFAVVQALTSRRQFRAAIAESLDALMYVLVFYFQLTNHQIETFDSDPSAFIDDEDEMNIRKHSVRNGADDLLGELITAELVTPEFAIATAVALLGAVVRRLEESSAARAAGDENWWRIREAAFFALGRVADEVMEVVSLGECEFDVPSFLEHVLLPELQSDASPYLLGRALWLASFFAHAVPPALAEAFVAAAQFGMSPLNPTPIRVCATTAMLHLCLSVDKAVTAPHMPETVPLLIEVIMQASAEPSVVTAVLTAMVAVLKTSPDALGPLEPSLGPFCLAMWIGHGGSHTLVSLVTDLCQLLLECADSFAPFAARVLPMVASILRKGPEAVGSYGFYCSAADVLKKLLNAAPAPLSPDVMSIFPVLASAFLSATDMEFMDVGTAALRVVLRKAEPDALVVPICEEGTVADLVLQCTARLLSGEVSEDGSVRVGSLIVTMIKALGGHLTEYLDRILLAVIDRLAGARFLPFIQSLVEVFAFMMQQQGTGPVLDFLAAHTCPNGVNGLVVLMGKWMDNEAAFSGEYGRRLSVVALVALMAPMDERVQNCEFTEIVPDVDEPVITRSQRRVRAEQTRQVPAPIKIFDLLVGHIVTIADDLENPDRDEEEDDSDSDSDLYEGAPGLSNTVSRRTGLPTFMDRDAFLLTEVFDMGVGHVPDDEDPETKADPTTEIRVGQYLTAFFRSFVEADPATFNAIAAFLSPGRQTILHRTLAGEFDL